MGEDCLLGGRKKYFSSLSLNMCGPCNEIGRNGGDSVGTGLEACNSAVYGL